MELDGKIRATDIGSFKFVARALDSSVIEAEETGNPIVIEEAMAKAVNRVVKWFIFILVIVFDPLAVTLVIAYNASLLKGNTPIHNAPQNENKKEKSSFFSLGNIILIFLLVGIPVWFFYDKYYPQTSIDNPQQAKTSLLSKLSSKKFDDRAFAYVPPKAFGVFLFQDFVCLNRLV